MRYRAGFDPDKNLWDLIAFDLRRQRQERDISLNVVGDIIGRDRSLVAYVENGTTKLQEKHAVKIDDAWRTGGLYSRLVRFAKRGHDVSWFATHLELEADADEIRSWDLGWMPGLFQTESYARAMFDAAGAEGAEAGAKARVERQQCLHRTPPPRVWAIIDERVITQPVGSTAIMRDQLAHLIKLAERSHISVRVVPQSVGAHAGRDGSFKIMTAGGADVVYTYAPGGGRLIQDATETNRYRVWFDLIGDVALPKDASFELIVQALERFP
ncbi:helix-turn-helix domain-containing protein [Actinoallomurus rhizosphaericola]|uniref:helix-turn-helix domain-containing protein n=1 Tax=Actinoallomurus rhizosphaericola TaxID=2952536 RepID=UPI002091D4DA|nr:helix-turn-helix transcriptional regulator [Actinoallomurus rhizosphaericola]MCO5993237.1 helix-turn-helix transcriptional regulator [Actinoallomurus rhizosphaericola]